MGRLHVKKKEMKKILKRALNWIVKGVPINNVTVNIVELSPNELLANRRALITGGTSGIGYEISKCFLKAGASVVITGRNSKKLQIACASLKEETKSNNIVGLVLDNSDVNSFQNKISEIMSFYGGVDILVNNAGVLTYNTISNEDEETYDKVLDTNLKGLFFLSQQIGRYMIENKIKGNILNVGSSSCIRPAISAYTLSKWGVRGLTLGLAKALAPYGITVNGIAPGQTLTGMVPNHEDIENIYRENIPLGRYILPEEIANMAVMLVSDMGRAIMGDMVYMTGGAGILTYEDIIYKF